MKPKSFLFAKSILSILVFTVVLAIEIFECAGVIRYWQAWLFLGIYISPCIAFTLYLLKYDSSLVARRMRVFTPDAKKPVNLGFEIAATVVFIVMIATSALDRRFGWSGMATAVSVLGDLLIAVAFVIFFVAFRANTFASALVEVSPDQHVISSGPYALVRHPMYFGALLFCAGVPLALGSWWGLLTVPFMKLIIIWRLMGEERLLLRALPGYAAYLEKVHYRLVPHVW